MARKTITIDFVSFIFVIIAAAAAAAVIYLSTFYLIAALIPMILVHLTFEFRYSAHCVKAKMKKNNTHTDQI